MHKLSAASVQLHEVNERIREMAGRFAATAGDDVPQQYLCECGCGAWVSLTRSEFDANIVSQRPVTAKDHVLARGRAARQLSRTLQRDAAALRAEARQKHRKSDELAERLKPPPE